LGYTQKYLFWDQLNLTTKMKLYLTLILAIVSSAIFGQAAPAADADPMKILEWRNIGPFRGGRSCAVTGVPGKPNLFYFGATGGGVWKTIDGGRTWSNISDGFFGGSIGSISVAASDNNVIYVGGGEKTVRGNVSFGYGVWKSEDAGKTWKKSGLETSRHIGRIRIHPTNPDIVVEYLKVWTVARHGRKLYLQMKMQVQWTW
jgi:hypothetical protein